jgi:DNA end-binding protein Ku
VELLRGEPVELVGRGKEQLVLIRPYKNGLVLRRMYHADEVRDFQQVPNGEKVKVSENELELGVDLIGDRHPAALGHGIGEQSVRQFGSWGKALLAAGIEIPNYAHHPHGLGVLEILRDGLDRRSENPSRVPQIIRSLLLR